MQGVTGWSANASAATLRSPVLQRCYMARCIKPKSPHPELRCLGKSVRMLPTSWDAESR